MDSFVNWYAATVGVLRSELLFSAQNARVCVTIHRILRLLCRASVQEPLNLPKKCILYTVYAHYFVCQVLRFWVLKNDHQK